MNLKKIFAAMSATALAASMLAFPASAEEATTQMAYNLGFNIQFGHFYGGTVTAKATGSGVLNTYYDAENRYIATDGVNSGETYMYAASDWSGDVENAAVNKLAITDGTGDATNPGWNGMWIQCYTTSLDDIKITFEFDLTGATFKELGDDGEPMTEWILLNAPNNAPGKGFDECQFMTTESTGTVTCTLDAATIGQLIEVGIITNVDEDHMAEVPLPSDDTGSGDTGSGDKDPGNGSGNGSGSTGSGSGSTGSGSGSGSTGSGSGSGSGSSSKNPGTGATAGLALAGLALAGAAIVATKKSK